MVLYEEQIRVGERETSLYISYFFEFWTVCMYYSFIKQREMQVHSSAYLRGRRVVMRGLAKLVGDSQKVLGVRSCICSVGVPGLQHS